MLGLTRARRAGLSSGGLPPEAEAVQADLADPASLEPHLHDAQSLFLLWPFTSVEVTAGLAPKIAEIAARHASVAVRVLTEDGHAGARYVLTGPEVLPQAEQLAAIGAAIGRDLTWEELSKDAALEALGAAWGDRAFAESAVNTWEWFVDHPETVNSTVRAITGVGHAGSPTGPPPTPQPSANPRTPGSRDRSSA